jgi:hypothetical protein
MPMKNSAKPAQFSGPSLICVPLQFTRNRENQIPSAQRIPIPTNENETIISNAERAKSLT